MNLIRQELVLDCLVCAAAMVTNQTRQHVLDFLGHDGCELAVPEGEGGGDPAGLIGFHPQELTDYFLSCGLAPVEIEVSPHSIVADQLIPITRLGEARWSKHLAESKLAILLIASDRHPHAHALAWDGDTQQVYDPGGRVYGLDSEPMQRVSLLAIIRLFPIAESNLSRSRT